MSKRSSAFSAAALMVSAVLLVAAASASAARHHGPPRLGPIEGRVHIGLGQTTSSNWSGYAAYGKESTPVTFGSVRGNWVQPTASCNLKGHKFALAAFWVGLDGYGNNTVEQTGTEADCEGKEPVYYAWYEFYPERLHLIEIEAKPGQEFHAEVTHSTLFLENVSTGEEETVEYEPGALEFATAEWIAEKPSSNFTDFGSVHFSGASATVGTTTGPIDSPSWENDSIIIGKGNPFKPKVLAQPGELEEEGSASAFTITQTTQK
jgi:Peptidase A4 family